MAVPITLACWDHDRAMPAVGALRRRLRGA
jgi:hypothetical protein